MNIFSWLFGFGRDTPAAHEASPTLEECINTLIEDGRKSTYGWNAQDAAKLQALWSSGQLPKPYVTFNSQGEVFVCPELAKELDKPGNEGLTELLVSMGKQGAAIEQRNMREGNG